MAEVLFLMFDNLEFLSVKYGVKFGAELVEKTRSLYNIQGRKS